MKEKYSLGFFDGLFEESLILEFKKAIGGLDTPPLDLEDTEKLLKNETTKINNQIDQMVVL